MPGLSEIKSIVEWPKMRPGIEKAVTASIGKPPKNRADLQLKIVDEFEGPGYTRRRVNYFVEEWERITAWLFVPDHKDDETPGIVCCHDAVPYGKDGPAGLHGEPTLAFARHFAERGYITIAPDCLTAGERVLSGLEPLKTRNFYKDHPRASLLGKMLYDHMHGVDALCETKGVDPARIGVIGHGFGGFNALMLAAFDERIQSCVSSCGFTRFHDDDNPARWVDNDGFVCVPKLKHCLEKREFPWDWEHILALAAPNPTLILTALNDDQLANTKSCEAAVKSAGNVYSLLGSADALNQITHKEGRVLNQRLLDESDEWFERWL